MKLRDLILELQKLERLCPDADLCFQSVEYTGNGTSSTEAGFVDAKLDGSVVSIRVTVPPYEAEKVRNCGSDC